MRPTTSLLLAAFLDISRLAVGGSTKIRDTWLALDVVIVIYCRHKERTSVVSVFGRINVSRRLSDISVPGTVPLKILVFGMRA